MNLRYLLFLYTICFVFGCKPTAQLGTGVKGEPVEFIVLQMNDVYEIAPLEGGKAGGLARVASIRKELMKENANTITILSGDFLSPSFLGTLKMENEEGQEEKIAGLQMIEALNALGLDYVTFGNHEFDLKDPVLLEKRMAQSAFEYTVCNATYSVEGVERPFVQKIDGVDRPVPEYILHEIAGANGQKVKVGFMGVVLAFSFPGYVKYGSVVESFRETYKELQTKADVCLAMTHLDVAEDEALADAVRGVPLFMGGHDHTQMSRYVNNTIIAKADANAKTVYIHRVRFDPATGYTSIRSNVRKIDDTIEEDSATKAVVDKWQNKANAIMKEMGYQPEEKVLTLTKPLNCKETVVRNEQTNYGKLTMDAIAAADPGADIYFINSGSMRLDDDLHGLVTQYDVLRTFPYGGNLVRTTLPGDVLQKVLQISNTTNKGAGGYLQVKRNATSSDGPCPGVQPIDPAKSYKVVLPGFVAAGKEKNLEFLKDYPKEPAKKEFVVDGQKVRNDIRDVVIHHMKKLGTY
ncbi:MAG: bifunctional metallophosphatase/5'-nucleotidase [Bacteroidota bacterium]